MRPCRKIHGSSRVFARTGAGPVAGGGRRSRRWRKKYADIVFLWIDIEDHADLLGDLDVENFPSLLIQYGDIVNFFGCIHPDAGVAERLLKSQLDTEVSEMKRLAFLNEEHVCWQKDVNLRALLRRAVKADA